MAETKKYNFGEKTEEFVGGQNLPVWQSPKYLASKEAAIALLESKQYKDVLCEGNFWILMNKTKSGKMAYTGLIISHDALLKINDVLPEDKRFNQVYLSEPKPFNYAGKTGLIMEYRDDRDGMYEVGEITPDNCQNGYPFAMLSKRIFDRVVKRKANLSGIYSDSEADEFKQNVVEEAPASKSTKPAIESPKLTPKPVSKPVKDESDVLTLADSLNHVLETGNNWKGKKIIELVEANTMPKDVKEKVLNVYLTRGTSNDKDAVKCVMAAIAVGKVALNGSASA